MKKNEKLWNCDLADLLKTRTASEVAKLCGCSQASVFNRMKSMGLTRAPGREYRTAKRQRHLATTLEEAQALAARAATEGTAALCASLECTHRTFKKALQRFDLWDAFTATQEERSEANRTTTMIARYGVTHALKSEEVKQKIRNIVREKYGVESVLNLPQVRTANAAVYVDPTAGPAVIAKARKTKLERYGPDGDVVAAEKSRKTFEARTGISHPARDPAVRAKTAATNIARGGFPCSCQWESTKAKSRKTCIERYGVEHPYLLPETIQRAQVGWRKKVEDSPEIYRTYHLCESQEFWDKLAEGLPLIDLAEVYQVEYKTLHTCLRRKHLKRYQEVYPLVHRKSKGQREVSAFITSLGVAVEEEVSGLLAPRQSLDILVRSANIAIEFNGSYWHSEAVRLDYRTMHAIKSKNCASAGIRLIHVWEHEWLLRRPQVENYLRSQLAPAGRVIHAKTTEIVVSHDHEFFDANHLQGAATSPHTTIRLVTPGDGTVFGMTFGKHHRGGEAGVHVLSRMCSKSNVAVVGGAARVLSHARKILQGSEIRTWSENRLTPGDIYAKLGFALHSESAPDYFYFDQVAGCYRSKQSQRKSAVGCPSGMTEHEWARSRRLLKIYDCGKKCWTLPLGYRG